jgi:hypothetical protein
MAARKAAGSKAKAPRAKKAGAVHKPKAKRSPKKAGGKKRKSSPKKKAAAAPSA